MHHRSPQATLRGSGLGDRAGELFGRSRNEGVGFWQPIVCSWIRDAAVCIHPCLRHGATGAGPAHQWSSRPEITLRSICRLVDAYRRCCPLAGPCGPCGVDLRPDKGKIWQSRARRARRCVRCFVSGFPCLRSDMFQDSTCHIPSGSRDRD